MNGQILASLFVSAFLPGHALQFQRTPMSRPNIVLFVQDDTSVVDLSTFGKFGNATKSSVFGKYPGTAHKYLNYLPTVDTPTLQQLFQGGAKFVNAYTPHPICTPARWAILTGRYASESAMCQELQQKRAGGTCTHTRNTSSLIDVSFCAFDVRRTEKVADLLHQEGYLTGSIGKQHNTPHPSKIGGDCSCTKYLKKSGFQFVGETYCGNLVNGKHNPAAMMLSAKRFFQQASGQPFFLYFALSLIHPPGLLFDQDVTKLNCETELTNEDRGYLTTEWSDMISAVTKRDAAILNDMNETGCLNTKDRKNWHICHQRLLQNSLADITLKHLLSTMRAAKVDMENTLLIFTSDHGPIEKGSLYEIGVRVPLLMHWPSQIRPGQTISTATSHHDLLLTILHAATGSAGWLERNGSFLHDARLSLLPTMSTYNPSQWGTMSDKFQKRLLYFESYQDRAIMEPATGQKVHMRETYCQENCTTTCHNDLRTRDTHWFAAWMHKHARSVVQAYNIFDDPAETTIHDDLSHLSQPMKDAVNSLSNLFPRESDVAMVFKHLGT